MSSEPTVSTVPYVDINRYLGVWFEIARKPMRHEDSLARDITATYTLADDGNIKVHNACINERGEIDESEGKATPVDDSNAKLEVTFLPRGMRWIPFTKGDYWIMRLDDSYETALIGEPERKYLWLLHRKPQLDESTRREWLSYAESQGYDISDLIIPKQSGAVHTSQDR